MPLVCHVFIAFSPSLFLLLRNRFISDNADLVVQSCTESYRMGKRIIVSYR